MDISQTTKINEKRIHCALLPSRVLKRVHVANGKWKLDLANYNAYERMHDMDDGCNLNKLIYYEIGIKKYNIQFGLLSLYKFEANETFLFEKIERHVSRLKTCPVFVL